MKKIVFYLTCCLLRWCGLPWFLREVYARRKVTIINYHNPGPEVFASHIRYFSRHYSFVSIDQVIDALEQKEFSTLPVKPLLITFDDGYAGNALLFPTLQRYHIPSVIYAVAGVVDTRRHFWFDKMPHQGNEMKTMKGIPDAARREHLQYDYNHWDEKEYDLPMALSAEELKPFVSLGGTVGSHTLFHPLLDRCEEEVGLRECRMSRERLEKLIVSPVFHFALPNGNFNDSVLDWVRRAGYRSCRTTKSGWVTSKTSCFFLPNFGVSDDADISKAAIQTCGLWDFFKQIMCR